MPECLAVFRRSNLFVSAFMLATAMVLSGCSYMGMGDDAGEKTVTWRSRDQFVRIEPQDLVRGKAPQPNDQPVELSPDRIRGALGQILIKPSPKAGAARLFTDYDLEILGTELSKALSQATARQDVTFAIQTWSKGLLSLREPKIVTGRVFYTGKRLNIIFGSIFRDGPAFEGSAEMSARNPDLRINPYVPGLRSFSLKQKALLSVAAGSGIFRPKGSKRGDWLIFSPRALVEKAPALSVKGRSARRDSDYQRLKKELDQVKRQMQTPQGAYPQQGYPAQQPYPPAGQVPVQPRAGTDTRSVDQRLATLDKLKSRGLISEEEYQTKRAEILQGF